MQLIYAFNNSESINLKDPQKLLIKSIEDMYNLYLLLISLLIEMHIKAEDYFDKIQKKHLATEKEKNPNKKFVKNKLLLSLRKNESFLKVLSNKKPNDWKLDSEYIDLIFKKIIESDIYKTYLSKQASTFQEDKTFVLDIFKNIIAPDEKLYDYLEDKKITWLDDFPVVNTSIVKLIKKAKANISDSHFVHYLYRDKEDRQFALDLLNKTILNQNEYNQEIALKTTNWDSDRLAKVDSILLKMAICELQNFPSIPTKVTINEYLEIAKEYSTPKSSVFINGILDKLVKEYYVKGKLNKVGRGLL